MKKNYNAEMNALLTGMNGEMVESLYNRLLDTDPDFRKFVNEFDPNEVERIKNDILAL